MPKSPLVQGEITDIPLDVDVVFDKLPVAFGPSVTAYPCHGATHTITVRPKPSSHLRDKEIKLLWGGDPAENLGVMVTPLLENAQLLTLEGVKWELNCVNTIRNGYFSLRLEVVKSGETTESLPMSLGHNLVRTYRWSTGPHYHQPGSTFYMRYLRATSVYLNAPAQGVNVSINGNPPYLSTDSKGECSSPEFNGESKNLSIINRYDGSIV